MLVFSNAKINLGLHVLGKREDGFHDIETIMVPIPLYDGLEVVTATTGTNVTFTASGIPVPDDGTPNICMRAYDLMQQYGDKQGKALPPLRIHLHKHIPIGAGLGGGSADAAFMLKALMAEYSIHIPKTTLLEMAASLGSDCPFFIENKPMLATGRGETLNAINIPALKSLVLVLAIPPIHISTAEAYRLLTPTLPMQPLREAIKEPIENWHQCLKNDFESVVFPNHPTIKKIKETFYEQGAIYASMSGSGSSVFGLFPAYLGYDGENLLQLKKNCAHLRCHILPCKLQHQTD